MEIKQLQTHFEIFPLNNRLIFACYKCVCHIRVSKDNHALSAPVKSNCQTEGFSCLCLSSPNKVSPVRKRVTEAFPQLILLLSLRLQHVLHLKLKPQCTKYTSAISHITDRGCGCPRVGGMMGNGSVFEDGLAGWMKR